MATTGKQHDARQHNKNRYTKLPCGYVLYSAAMQLGQSNSQNN
jgi:hypothetical protein